MAESAKADLKESQKKVKALEKQLNKLKKDQEEKENDDKLANVLKTIAEKASG
jgi:septal ring factor EnvC (AmiA/AmiB activator)